MTVIFNENVLRTKHLESLIWHNLLVTLLCNKKFTLPARSSRKPAELLSLGAKTTFSPCVVHRRADPIRAFALPLTALQGRPKT